MVSFFFFGGGGGGGERFFFFVLNPSLGENLLSVF